MLALLKTMILDFQAQTQDLGVPRHVAHYALKGKANVYMGVRRSGKSTFLYQIQQKLISQGLDPTNILSLNFFDERLASLTAQSLGLILEAYFSIYPEKKNTSEVVCFFDEIQEVPGFEPFIERILRQENCQVYLTGSSAKLLSTEIATQMRGRALSFEIFPFSLQEYLDSQNIAFKVNLTTKERLAIQKAFEQYLLVGGFPETLSLPDNLRVKIHQEYWQTILFRDIVERHNVKQPRELLDLARWCINNIASLYSINNLTGYLKSLGYKTSKATVAEYLTWFEDAYIFFSVYIFDASVNRMNVNPKKIYAIDHSFVRSISNGILINTGHLLENFVFICLRRHEEINSKIYYYRTKQGEEIDFIVKINTKTNIKIDTKIILFQVCLTLVNDKTKKRELKALVHALQECNVDYGFIITLNEEEIITIEDKDIVVISAWRFALLINHDLAWFTEKNYQGLI